MAESSNESDNDLDNVLIGGVEKVDIRLAEYDSSWPGRYAAEEAKIRSALGQRALQVEHIGSTAVPGLAAKPIIDILLVVEDSGDESAYLPDLEAAGYQLRVREKDFHEHRMVRTPERDVHVHVFSPGCEEIDRYLLLRDRLRSVPEDHELYEKTKRDLAAHQWDAMNTYAEAKTKVVEGIIDRAREASQANPA